MHIAIITDFLKTRHFRTSQSMPTSADYVCMLTATHQTLGQQRGTEEDSYIHLANWTLSVRRRGRILILFLTLYTFLLLCIVVF